MVDKCLHNYSCICGEIAVVAKAAPDREAKEMCGGCGRDMFCDFVAVKKVPQNMERMKLIQYLDWLDTKIKAGEIVMAVPTK